MGGTMIFSMGDEFFYFFLLGRRNYINTKAYRYIKSLYIWVCTY